eukprot:4343058-Lingulodinium_polyedra.AAC.1
MVCNGLWSAMVENALALSSPLGPSTIVSNCQTAPKRVYAWPQMLPRVYGRFQWPARFYNGLR